MIQVVKSNLERDEAILAHQLCIWLIDVLITGGPSSLFMGCVEKTTNMFFDEYLDDAGELGSAAK